MFVRACPVAIQEDVRAVLNVTMPVFEEKYLRSTYFGRSHVQRTVSKPTSKSDQKVDSWGDGHLAQAGREVLIKSIA